MNGKLKALCITLPVLLLITGGLWYGKRALKATQPVGAPLITQKESSFLDLRPAAIAKLQQLVKDGSDSLYNLRVDSLLTDIASGTITLKGVAVLPDSAVIRTMQAQHRLPDDVFQIRFAVLRVSGIGLADLLHRRDISLRAISCERPQIIVQHHLQSWNAGKRAEKQPTLFARLHDQLDRLAIDSVSILNADITDYSAGPVRSFKNVSLALRGILIDSTAEADSSRFLFAKSSEITAGDITLPVGKSYYDLSIGGLSISGGARQVTIHNLALRPRGGKDAFTKHQKTQGEVYDIAAPLITFRGMNWWAAAHGEAFIAKAAEAEGPRIYVYLDKRMPESPGIKRDDFPQQLLTSLSVPVSFSRITLKKSSLTYEEYTKASDKQSSISFNDMNAVADGVTNIPVEIKRQPAIHFSGSCRFMNVAPMSGSFTLELPRGRRGAFTGDLRMGGFGYEAIDTFAEAMGLVRFTGGQLQEAGAHIEGNNDNVHGTIAAAYTGLHVTPLKAQEDDNGRLKQHPILKVLANGLIKNNNPAGGGKLRQPGFSLDRTTEGNFFNFTWLGLKQGMLKTIGVPPRLGM